MKLRYAAAATAAMLIAASAAQAGVIERACNNSNRSAANRSLCNCIQKVADATLDRQDQRLAASFFKKPHKAQEIRQSDNSRHEVFWKKYQIFGAKAQDYCS